MDLTALPCQAPRPASGKELPSKSVKTTDGCTYRGCRKLIRKLLHAVLGPRSAFSGPAGKVGAGEQGVGVLWAGHSLARRQQLNEQIAGGGRVARLPGPTGEFVPGGHRAWVLRAEDALEQGQQGGEKVSGAGRIPCLSGPVGKVAAGPEGVWVASSPTPAAARAAARRKDRGRRPGFPPAR